MFVIVIVFDLSQSFCNKSTNVYPSFFLVCLIFFLEIWTKPDVIPNANIYDFSLIFCFFSNLGHVKNLKLKNSVVYLLKLSIQDTMYQYSMYQIFSIPSISNSNRFPGHIKQWQRHKKFTKNAINQSNFP